MKPSATLRHLDELQRESFAYFEDERCPGTQLVRDSTDDGSPVSIAATGFALAAWCVGERRGFLSREDAARRTLECVRFFHEAEQSEARDATGYRGFFYHWLDPSTLTRTWDCELSTIDTALLVAGLLISAQYFDRDLPVENEIRQRVQEVYERIEWDWACAGERTLRHGWTPEGGFLPYAWRGYNEGLILYVLALGSDTHGIDPESYDAWCETYEWRRLYGLELLHASSLFIHQYSHVWLDLRGIRDAFLRSKGLDYFENSRRAVIVQQRYAIENPRGFRGYDEWNFGLSASRGPGPEERVVEGVKRSFLGYVARGVPDGPDDGTLAPWAVAGCLPFLPELILPFIEHHQDRRRGEALPYGFSATYNPTHPGGNDTDGTDTRGWVCDQRLGLNQGPILLMIENHRSDLLWSLSRRCAIVRKGLERAGFEGGWLEEIASRAESDR